MTAPRPPVQPIFIAPSILAADFARLGEDVAAAAAAGADWIHVDVMDGHFVPNISIGLPVVQSLRAATSLPLDVHLMIERPERWIDAFARAGADGLTVHVEACPHLHAVVQQIRATGLRAGVALNPATPLALLEEILPDVDLVLVMTVNPGFGGQTFLPRSLARLTALRQQLTALDLSPLIEVDGGISEDNAGAVVAAGATILVAGSAIFRRDQPVAAGLAALRRAVAAPAAAGRLSDEKTGPLGG